MTLQGCADPGRARIRRAVRRWFPVLVAGVVAVTTGTTAARLLDPWQAMVRHANAVVVAEGCSFSEAALRCLDAWPFADGPRPVVGVSTDPKGPLAERLCAHVRSRLAGVDDWRARVGLHVHPESLWCRRLSTGAAHELLERHGRLEWSAFVAGGRLVGVGLSEENLRSVGATRAADMVSKPVSTLRGAGLPVTHPSLGGYERTQVTTTAARNGEGGAARWLDEPVPAP